MRDEIFSRPGTYNGNFVFDSEVVDVFPDMISRSVPGYAAVIKMVGQLAARFAIPDSNIYDLGCSLGAATALMRKSAPVGCTIHAVDNSPAMVARLRNLVTTGSAAEPGCSVEIHEADLCSFQLSSASFVVLNWTLQFVPQPQRQELLRTIHTALVSGGALLLSEKICFADSRQQRLLNDLHHDFKRANGYSDLEISRKRQALENTLIPETLESHIQRLEAVGFATVAVWFQCFNFVSILAVK